MYAAIIYDSKNIITRVERRYYKHQADGAGKFFTRKPGWWYRLTNDQEEIDLAEAMINA